ncbi:hypothetical protein BC829DRAFT_400929 [Chytridium lagenaria]|nr:hypothetical protein BC829DRAFT_400929 [Chytridium lagenaria]
MPGGEEPKAHRARQAGPKAEKKKGPNKNAEKNNPKAFASYSGRRAEKAIRRNLDKDQTRLHMPLTGKSTLIRSLIRHYTKQNLTEVTGPITVVSGKNRRLTFIECSNDLNSMIDIAKVVDLVLLVIDASFGFEMETFEFLNVLQCHGFPKVMGVLTFLDKFRDNKRQRKVKKRIKQRFWTEIYQGAKLFYLSGMINNKYLKQDVLNLARFISITKFRPLIWRNTHPYVLVDRVEDLTDPNVLQENPKANRTVSVFGYLRGTNLKPSTRIHIPGVGDLSISEATKIPDPCPLPDKVRKRLSEKHKLIYAPMSDLGGIVYDKDAVYIHVPGHLSNKDGEDLSAGDRMVMDLQESRTTFSDKMKLSEMKLFSSSEPMTISSFDMESDDEVGETEDAYSDDDENIGEDGADDDDDDDSASVSSLDSDDDYASDAPHRAGRRRVSSKLIQGEEDAADIAFAESDSDLSGNEHDDENDVDEPSGLVADFKRVNTHLTEFAGTLGWSQRENLGKLIYSDVKFWEQEEAEQPASTLEAVDNDLLFKTTKRKKVEKPSLRYLDTCKFEISDDTLAEWSDEEMLDSIRGFFVTGADAQTAAEGGEEVFGDFEDLENGTIATAAVEGDAEAAVESLEEKKEKLKRKFDEIYDEDEDDKTANVFENAKADQEKQTEINKAEFRDDDEESRVAVEGHKAGSYVRIIIKGVAAEFIENFDPSYPIIAGGLLQTEETFGFIQARIKKHRWHKKILKTNDPMVFSLGWRRFQSIPLYSLNDGTRNRMLKYSPEHMHCLAAFYGPVTPPQPQNFRVSATGVILDIDQSVETVKKLKLTGTPYKIFKNTAFIKDMFTTRWNIRTVSGIRGQVKKALPKPEGTFRATFEDKILLSDIVFLRAWYPVKPKRFYNPVCSLLLAKKTEWSGLRLTGQIRADKALKAPLNKDSLYKDIERKERKFNKLSIPKSLQNSLPFTSKPKLDAARKKPTLMQRRAVLLEPDEKKVYHLMQTINTIKNDKDRKGKAKTEIRRGRLAAMAKAREEEADKRRKTTGKKIFKKQQQSGGKGR